MTWFERGIIAGVEVAPRARSALAFSKALQSALGAADPAQPEHKSKRAAVGFSLKFYALRNGRETANSQTKYIDGTRLGCGALFPRKST